MATADQYETAIGAVATAVATLTGYGSTGGIANKATVVTATSTRRHQVKVFSAKAIDALFRELDQGAMGVRPTVGPKMATHSAVLIADTPTERYVIARLKK